MTQMQGECNVDRICELAKVSRASFYRNWEQTGPDEAETAIRDAVQKEALENRRYGYRRIAVMVQRKGVAVSAKRVLTIMREDNLLAVRRRKFVATTDSGHDFHIYSNLAQYMALKDVNQLWVADISICSPP